MKSGQCSGAVVASTRRGGGRLFDIDILAIDNANTPVIVERKWDRIDSGPSPSSGRTVVLSNGLALTRETCW